MKHDRRIETGMWPGFPAGTFFGLQQNRWPPTLIADSPESARDALFMLPGAHYADPLLSWRFVIEPAALLSGNAALNAGPMRFERVGQ